MIKFHRRTDKYRVPSGIINDTERAIPRDVDYPIFATP
jgi:hypothetical protein